MDTPEPQKQFELWWAWHSISRLKSLSQENSDPKCRNNIVVFTNNNTKHWCKCLDTLSRQIKQYPPKSGTISEPSTSSFTSQRNPKASWGFPTNILLRGHGPGCSLHPRPPSPRGAAGPRNRGRRQLPFAAVFRLGSRSRSPSHGQNPTEGSGEKVWENFGRLKSRSFGICGHSKILPKLQEHCGFEDVLMTSSWLKKLLPLDFGSQNDVDNKPKHILQLRSKVRPKSLYFILFLQSKLGCTVGNDTNRKCWCKCLGTLAHFSYEVIHKIHETPEPSTFRPLHNGIPCPKRFPPNILLRGHGRLCSVHPRPPSPRGAAGPRNRGGWGLPSAAVWSLGSRGPSSSHWQNPTERGGEKFSENFGHLKNQSFGNCGHSKILPGLKEHCAFEMFWWHRVGWKRPCEPDWQSKCFEET